MARCSRLVIFYFKEKFFVLHASASHLQDVYFQSVPKTLQKKSYLRLYLTQIVHSNSKMLFFSHIIVYQSFYGALLTFSYFLLQGKILCFARVGKSLARCLFPQRSKDLVEKIISPECRAISLDLTQIAAKYRSRSNNRTREISLKKKTANFCVQTILPK